MTCPRLIQKFVGTINQRLERIQDTVGRALPAIREPGKSPLPISDVFERWPLSSSGCHFQVPRQITEVTEAHVEEFDRQRRVVEEATPPYSVDELM